MVKAPGGGQLWDPSYDAGLLRVEDFGLDAWWLARDPAGPACSWAFCWPR